MLRKINFKEVYSSEQDDIYNLFYRPALQQSILYRRAVGFFSLGALLNAPTALTELINHEGQVQLIIGKIVSVQDFEALKAGEKIGWEETLDIPFERIIQNHSGTLLEHRVRMLAWLFQHKRLEIKFAIRPKGLFHQKIGIFTDRFGDSVAFNGSLNDTNSALDPRYNSEEVSVFCPWIEGQKPYYDRHLATFEKLWSEQTDSQTIIAPLPEALRSGLNFVSSKFPDQAPNNKLEEELVKKFIAAKNPNNTNKPNIPMHFKGNLFDLRKHQKQALIAWKANGYNGVLELATGAGKTVTAIFGAVRTIENNEGFVLIIAAPYTDLADQWCEELRIFGIHAIKCYGNRASWEAQLSGYVNRNDQRQTEFLAIVVVNNTLKSDHFQSHINRLDAQRLFFIGDECHHHSAIGYIGKTFPKAQYRIGLSATPFDYINEDKNARLREIYDKSVYTYSLGDAVRDGVLTPYDYLAIPVELTVEEAEEYINLSEKISRAFIIAQNSKNPDSSMALTILLMKRARLVGAAQNKLPMLRQLLKEQGGVQPYTLFYCGDGKTRIDSDDTDELLPDDEDYQIERKQRYEVAKIIGEFGGKVSPFTADENRQERRQILENFKSGKVDALVAIKCLDEGIDVPACRTAYLIASSRNPRQFIQRRGRILRKSEGKIHASVFDFVVVLPQEMTSHSDLAGDFLRAELGRVADFASNSRFPNESLSRLQPWIEAYDLSHLAL